MEREVSPGRRGSSVFTAGWCGRRWRVRYRRRSRGGSGSDHGRLTAKPTTVAQLDRLAGAYRPDIQSGLPRAVKHFLLPDNRTGLVEQSLWQITGRVACDKPGKNPNSNGNFACRPGGNNGVNTTTGHKGDGDIEFALYDGTGTIHCEMPHMGCFDNLPDNNSSWRVQMAVALTKMQTLIRQNWNNNHRKKLGGFCVTVQGLGFFDLWDLHGKKVPLGLELHPLLKVVSASSCPALPPAGG